MTGPILEIRNLTVNSVKTSSTTALSSSPNPR